MKKYRARIYSVGIMTLCLIVYGKESAIYSWHSPDYSRLFWNQIWDDTHISCSVTEEKQTVIWLWSFGKSNERMCMQRLLIKYCKILFPSPSNVNTNQKSQSFHAGNWIATTALGFRLRKQEREISKYWEALFKIAINLVSWHIILFAF